MGLKEACGEIVTVQSTSLKGQANLGAMPAVAAAVHDGIVVLAADAFMQKLEFSMAGRHFQPLRVAFP